MAERTTKSQIQSAFDYFLKEFGFKKSKGFNITTRKNDPGMALDHSNYGGYTIVELNSENTGESQPFGSRRYSPSEFYELLWFATHASEAKRRRRR